jgi:two-component system response regulator PilR (NtrC family)
VLVVDDESSMREFLAICLGRAGHDVVTASGGAEAIAKLDLLSAGGFDLVVTDLTMPGVGGMEVLRHANSLPEPPLVLMITAFATSETAIQALKLGAWDYLTKPFKVDEILVVVARALERARLGNENRRLREALRGVGHLDRMIGRSVAMQKVFELVRKVAPTRTNVLIRGESGTGKELVARALHNLSERAKGPFIGVNCGAIPENLMESELFGHVKGAFTGASQAREGVFVAAQGGTLFLDEIGELSLQMQVKLLRALQERRVRPVGGEKETEIDCRVVAATNRDLEAAIAAGEFRNDLYFRLDVVQVVLPPLRHRAEDIPLLVDRFFERLNREHGRNLRGIAPEAMERFLHYEYPGNVRELENLVERAVALETGDMLSADHLPVASPRTRAGSFGSGSAFGAGLTDDVAELDDDGRVDLDQAVSDLERRLIGAALRKSGGVRKEAAKRLGISFRSLRYRLEKLGIEVARGDADSGDDS